MSDPQQVTRTVLLRAAKKLGILPAVAAALENSSNTRSDDGSNWREGFKSFGQLTTEMPKFLIEGLVPEKALTAICAPSFNCKTWLSLGLAYSLSTGSDYLCFKGPDRPVPCRYHVPEMHEAAVRNYMAKIGFQESDHFLVRTMEAGLWPLDEPRMIRSSVGAVTFLDTAGYFNPADDTSSYKQSLDFANRIYNLLQQGALAVVALFHPPKYAKDPGIAWSLENSILGSAGYGGILRSCLRMQNLNADLNDSDVWVYVQGMKNPGLRPFQLDGPPPLRMKVPPGQSPYLSEIKRSDDPRRDAAFKGFKEGKTQRQLVKELVCSASTLTKWRKEYDELNPPTEVKRPTDFGETLPNTMEGII